METVIEYWWFLWCFTQPFARFDPFDDSRRMLVSQSCFASCLMGFPNRIVVMARFTLDRGESAHISDATELIRSVGARVIAAKPRLALIESTDFVADQLREVLRDWRVTREVTAKIPKPRPKLPRRNGK